MKIKRVSVNNLFDAFSYAIDFKEHNPISIIHAPNGYGKTTVFRIMKAILDMNFGDIITVPFSGFLIEFTDEYTIMVEQTITNAVAMHRLSVNEVTYSIYKKEKCVVELNLPPLQSFYDYASEEGIEDAVRRFEMRRRHVPAEERERADQINLGKMFQKYKETMEEIRRKISVQFIDANRLYAPTNIENGGMSEKRRLYRGENYLRDENGRIVASRRDMTSFVGGTNEKIVIDANDIFEQIQRVRQRYSLESEKQDRDFPDRLVSFVESSRDDFYSDEEIAEKLKMLEEKRQELENAGRALAGKKSLAPTKDIDETMRKFYTLYIDDTFKKLSLYDDIKKKLELFIEIINKKTAFSNKVMCIDNERGIVFEPINSTSGKKRAIPLSKLSSGEKHDFILFYELIFKSNSNSVFLIDEPEISLHVAWQMEFISVLEKICESNNMQAIVATHSPDIVNGHDDLLISLDMEEDSDGI